MFNVEGGKPPKRTSKIQDTADGVAAPLRIRLTRNGAASKGHPARQAARRFYLSIKIAVESLILSNSLLSAPSKGQIFCLAAIMVTVSTPAFTTSTNLGPMTTPMSFPTNCLSSLYNFNTFALGLPWTYMTQGCALSTCCPYDNYYTEGWAWMTSYYSPAVCPVAYKTCVLPTVFSTFSAVSGESIALCCPYDYPCGGADSNGACFSLLATATSVVVLDNIYDQSIISTSEWTLPLSWQEQGLSSYQIAYPIQVRWKEGDWDSKTPATTTPPGTTTTGGGEISRPTQTSGPAATSSGTSASVSSTSSSKLSTGSIVGIVTGSISAVATVLGLAFKIYKWKHPTQKQVVEVEPKRTTGGARV